MIPNRRIFNILKVKFRAFFIFLLICLVLTGCWDMREIERRLFVGGVGIDVSDKANQYEFSFSIPIVREIVGSPGGGGGGGGPAVALESSISESITEATRDMALRFNRDLFFEHMRIIVIGEDAARQGLRQVINPFIRQTYFNRRSRIAIAEGSAKKILEVEPWVEKIGAEYLQTIYAKVEFTGEFVDGDFGDFIDQIHAFSGNALVSKIAPREEEVYIGGAAVIKDYKLVGWLSEEETQGVNFMLGEMRGGSIVVDDPKTTDKATFSILRAQRKIYLVSTEPTFHFNVKIEVEGDITEVTEGRRIEDYEIQQIQILVAEKIKEQVNKGVSKLQKDYRVDLVRLNDYLYKYHHRIWDEYKDEWEEAFETAQISVDVDVQVQNFGITK